MCAHVCDGALARVQVYVVGFSWRSSLKPEVGDPSVEAVAVTLGWPGPEEAGGRGRLAWRAISSEFLSPASDYWQKPRVWVGLAPELVNSVFCESSS